MCRFVLLPVPFTLALSACVPELPEDKLAAEGAAAGDCTDDADNDEDGLFDCDDDGCAGSDACTAAPGAPEGLAVAIDPTTPMDADDLRCAVTTEAVDPNGDAVSYAFAWSVDGADAGLSSDTVGNALTVPGQTWTCTVTPSDGTLTGTPGSASVSIQRENAAPSAPGVAITPAEPTDDDALTCAVVTESVDPDGDAVTYAWAWTVDGVDAGVTVASVDAARTNAGETWTCSVTASDGVATGEAGSATVGIAALAECAGDVSGLADACDDGNARECDGCEGGETRRFLAFDTSASFVRAAVSASLFDGSAATDEIWFRTTLTNDGSANTLMQAGALLMGVGTYNSGTILSGQVGGADMADALNCRVYDAADSSVAFEVRSDSKVNDGAWHHLACVFDGTTLTAYFDGAPEGSMSRAGVAPYLFDIVAVNYDDAHRRMSGDFDEARYSNVARYSGRFTPERRHETDCDTVALWHVDDASGTTIRDASENRLDLTSAGSAIWTGDDCYGGVVSRR